jgi:hypothetical protein
MFEVGWPQRPTVPDHLSQGRPLHVLGDEVGLRTVRVGVQHSRRGETPHPPSAFGLPPEARPELRMFSQIRTDHLDGDPLALGTDAEEDGAHPTLTEPAADAVGTELAWVVRPQRGDGLSGYTRRCGRHSATPPEAVRRPSWLLRPE